MDSNAFLRRGQEIDALLAADDVARTQRKQKCATFACRVQTLDFSLPKAGSVECWIAGSYIDYICAPGRLRWLPSKGDVKSIPTAIVTWAGHTPAFVVAVVVRPNPTRTLHRDRNDSLVWQRAETWTCKGLETRLQASLHVSRTAVARGSGEHCWPPLEDFFLPGNQRERERGRQQPEVIVGLSNPSALQWDVPRSTRLSTRLGRVGIGTRHWAEGATLPERLSRTVQPFVAKSVLLNFVIHPASGEEGVCNGAWLILSYPWPPTPPISPLFLVVVLLQPRRYQGTTAGSTPPWPLRGATAVGAAISTSWLSWCVSYVEPTKNEQTKSETERRGPTSSFAETLPSHAHDNGCSTFAWVSVLPWSLNHLISSLAAVCPACEAVLRGYHDERPTSAS